MRLENFTSRLQSIKLIKRKKEGSHKAQSLVELAITLPLLLMMLSGLVEFGFMLNYYLSLNDVTRETARFFSNFDPFNADGTDDLSTDGLYVTAAGFLLQSLEPIDANDTSRKIKLDPTTDDIVISVFSISGDIVKRFPTSGDYHWFGNDGSRFDTAEVSNRLVSGSPNTGILLVEVFYDYHQVLGLPWLTAFIPDPVTLYAYTMMPLAAAEPTPTPIP
ncbi:MAG: pilus assembly protein [Anaerolineales bacterium]|nr:pilus assembly protein [Anaerolineales bacterium]